MPLYEYLCPKGHRSEAVRPMSLSKEPIQCSCGLEAGKIISAVRGFGDIEGYESPASGKWIDSMRARREDFARTGTREYELGEREHFLRGKADEEKKFDNFIDEAVEKTAVQLSY